MVKNYTNTISKIFKKLKSLINKNYIPIVILLSFLLMILIIRRYENFEEETTEDTTNDCSEEKTEIATLQGDLTKQENAAKQKETELNGKLTELQTKYDTDTKNLKSRIDELQGIESKYNNAAEKYSQIKNEFDSLTKQSNDNNIKLNNTIKELKNQIVRCEKGEGFQDTQKNNQSVTEQNDDTNLIIDQTNYEGTENQGTYNQGTDTGEQSTVEVKDDQQTDLVDYSKKFGITNIDLDGKKTDSLNSDTADNQQILSLLNVNMESILGASKFKKVAEDQIKNDTRQNFRLNRISNILYKF